MYVKKFNETSPIASSASHEITIIKPDTIRTIIIGYEQKAIASVVMQIACAINQELNHRTTARDVIMRLLEKITHDVSKENHSVVKTDALGTVTGNTVDHNGSIDGVC